MNLDPPAPYAARLQALDWLLRAIRAWLSQATETPHDFPQVEGVQWNDVGDLAYVHNLEPLLFWTISTRDTGAEVPRWLWEKWEQAYFETFLQNEERLHILDVLMGGCKRAGVPVIVLKGPALIGRIYRDPALRPMSDLDILCAKSDLGTLIQTVMKMGYKMGAPGHDPAASLHVAMHHVKTGALLEFHFRPYDTIHNHPLFMEKAWDQMEWIDVHGISCPVLSLEMEFFFDLAHLAHHQFDVSLKHLVDMAGMLTFWGERLRWDEIEDLCEFRLERAYEMTVGFVSQAFHLPQLSHLVWDKRENDVQRVSNASLMDLLALLDQPRLMDTEGVIRGFLRAFRQQEGLGQQLGFLRDRIFPSLNEMPSQHAVVTMGHILRYYANRILFYFQRFLLTVAHLPRKSQGGPNSLAVQRAAAKNRLTRLLVSV
jgi:hypothetical protein